MCRSLSSDLAVQLVQSYEYPSAEDRAAGNHDVASDVEYFVNALYDIGYLKSAPDDFSKQIYAEVNVDE